MVAPVWDLEQNHGRNSALKYTGCPEIFFSHATLKFGDCCPECANMNLGGKLGQDKPQVIVKLEGGPLITGHRYVAEILRCNLCKDRYYTEFPPEIKNAPKYDVSCASAIAIGRYSLGLPLYRMEANQSMHGIPLPDATQWDILNKLYNIVAPIYKVMQQNSANGNLMIYDDTPNRILEEQARGKTTRTTAYVSVQDDNITHLFFTGQKHAGNNADMILAQRTTDEPVIAMMDASQNNIPKYMSAALTAKFILCFCLTHGRRKFFEMFNFFDKECELVLDIIGQVYHNDDYCKKHKYTPEQRLAYHKQYSQPLMHTLYTWLNNQLLYEQHEENSGLLHAVKYMLRHWIPLTTFLRVAGAPLDSSWAERAIKIVIRHRRNSLFYKTTKGSLVGDCLMSLICTCQQNNVNPFDYLNTLQRHAIQVAAEPNKWLPWNYLQHIIPTAVNKAA